MLATAYKITVQKINGHLINIQQRVICKFNARNHNHGWRLRIERTVPDLCISTLTTVRVVHK